MNAPASDHVADLYDQKVYTNSGNAPLLALVPPESRRVLDIGCGAGSNAAILRQRGCQVWGVTLSEAEAEIARRHCEEVVVGNVESMDLDFPPGSFDTLILSHVLEHMIRPDRVLSRLAPYLADRGRAFVAVPNMASYRLRLRLLLGNWRREESGEFDRTHYHFWSYVTIDEVFRGTPFRVLEKRSESYVPLWPLRRLAPPRLLRPLDEMGGRLLPNLFARQTLVVLEKDG